MAVKDNYPAGAPCWVDTLQPEPRAALEFYGSLLGWSFDDARSRSTGLAEGEYFTARIDGRRVTGIGQAPAGSPGMWTTHILVDDVEQAVARAEAAGGACLAKPTDVGSDGRLAVLTDATGVPFFVRQASGNTGAELVGEPGSWAMSSLHSTDLTQAEGFYGTVFGWELEHAPDAPLAKWHLDGQVVAVLTETDEAAVPAHWSINFCARDADAIADRATELGGTVMMTPFDTPGFRNTIVVDPQGGVIAISAPVS